MSERIALVLDEARALIADGHWCKGRNENHGSYCLLGAIKKAATGDPYGNNVLQELASKCVRKQLHPISALTLFNDKHTYEEVDALLAKAAAEARKSA